MKFLILASILIFQAGIAAAGPLPQRNGMSLFKMVSTGRAKFEAREERELRMMEAAFYEREHRRSNEQTLGDYKAELVLAFGRSIDTTVRKHTLSLSSDEGPACAGLATSCGLIVPLHALGPSDSRTVLSREANLAIVHSKTSQLDLSSLSREAKPRAGSFVCIWHPDGRISTGTITSTTVNKSGENSSTLQEGRREFWKKAGFSPSHLKSKIEQGIECDLSIEESELGSPVFDLRGKIVGLTVARLDVHRTVVIPIDTIKDALEKCGKQ